MTDRPRSYYSATVANETSYPPLQGTVEVDIAIIGGGAAGFFTAINCAEANPDCRVTIF